jgi:hypothetical protein
VPNPDVPLDVVPVLVEHELQDFSPPMLHAKPNNGPPPISRKKEKRTVKKEKLNEKMKYTSICVSRTKNQDLHATLERCTCLFVVKKYLVVS